jgi:hypothetical protein
MKPAAPSTQAPAKFAQVTEHVRVVEDARDLVLGAGATAASHPFGKEPLLDDETRDWLEGSVAGIMVSLEAAEAL